jgi:oligopeptide/dipeptide ABC transporter, ATP-binding protein, C-terminal domain
MSEKLLSIENLVIHFETDDGVVEAVNGVSLSLTKGETLGLVGETGAGKTTTALGIMRLIPDPPGRIISGSIHFGGEDVLSLSKSDLQKYRGHRVSMIFQDPMTSLNPVINVGNQIVEAIELHKDLTHAEAITEAENMLELVGIPKERFQDYPHQFSGGMKQRVVIAIALCCNPELLIADEPTTALDVTIQAQVLDMMRKLKEEFQTSMIMITHDLGVVAETCDRVAIIYAGQIIEMGDRRDIFKDSRHPYTIGLFNSIPRLDQEVHRLESIKGLMPDSMNLPKGCNFCERCTRSIEICKDTEPEMKELTPGHFVKCHVCTAEAEEVSQ